MPTTTLQTLTGRLRGRWRRTVSDRHNRSRLANINATVAAAEQPAPGAPPVAFFRASSGILHLSQNAAFSLLASWGLRLSGVPVAHFACQSGMSRCIQGLNRDDFSAAMPCDKCIAQTGRTHAGAQVHWFNQAQDSDLEQQIAPLNIPDLENVTFGNLSLGRLVLPGLRWILRRHHLPDDEPTAFLFREYILSAYRVAEAFRAFLDEVQPQALVVFNGLFFPEAVARTVARQRGLRVISHEVGFQPLSAFFTEGDATAYPIEIPEKFNLSSQQEALLNGYLEQRFQGQFTMAGIRFWPEMEGLSAEFLAHAGLFRQLVPVFTNVVFDTSQVHANTVYPHMFAWLDDVLNLIRRHPDTLFVIRAHPDEMRQGKECRECVASWFRGRGLHTFPNVVFVAPTEHISSYELIDRAKFVMVYNSSIGLEAALLGATVVGAGAARYSKHQVAHFPDTAEEVRRLHEQLLTADQAAPPAHFRENARRFLYYQFYRASLPFSDFLESDPIPGFVRLRDFAVGELHVDRSPAVKAIYDGIVRRAPFLLPD